MKLVFIVLVFGIPGFYASLDHLSYRIRREDPDAEVEGSGAGLASNLNPTLVDDESESPDETTGGDVIQPETTRVTEVQEPPAQPEESLVVYPPDGAANPPEQPNALDSEIILASTTMSPPTPIQNQPQVDESTTDLPVLPIDLATNSTNLLEERELEGGRGENPPSTDPDFSFGEPTLKGAEKISSPSLLFPKNETQASNGIGDKQIPEFLEPNDVDATNSRKTKPLPNGDGNSVYNKDKQVNDLSDNTEEKWSFIPVDDLSLLIFILLCLILIVILLVCCFIIQHMTSWTIVKMVPRLSSNTYENTCPVKDDEDVAMVKYTAEKEGAVQLLSVSKLQAQSQSYKEEMNLNINEEKTFSIEQNEQTVHRSTAEVLIGDSDPVTHYPIIIATVRKDGTLNGTRKEMILSRSTSAGSRDTWLKETLGQIEHEDAELESRVSFNEISTSEKENPNFGNMDSTNMSFLQKFAVNTTNKKTVTTHSVSTLQNTSTKNVILNIESVGMEKSKSLDELSADDELDDYLENASFPV